MVSLSPLSIRRRWDEAVRPLRRRNNRPFAVGADHSHFVARQMGRLLDKFRLQEAIELGESWSSEHPNQSCVWIALGTAYRETHRLDKAIECWTAAVNADPDSGEASFFLLCGLTEQGRGDEREAKELLSALKVDPNDLTLDRRTATAMELYDRLARFGLVVVRNCFYGSIIKRWQASLDKNLARLRPHDYADIASRDLLGPVSLMVEHADADAFSARLLKNIENNVVLDPNSFDDDDVRQVSGPLMWSLSETPLQLALWEFLGSIDYSVRLNLSALRVITARGVASNGGPHQDCRLQRRQEPFATFWIPFNSCGGTRAPSLAFVPIRLDSYFPIDPDPADPTALIVSRPTVPEELYYKPELEPGDAIIHSTFTLHKTLLTAEMHGRRTSVDIRLF